MPRTPHSRRRPWRAVAAAAAALALTGAATAAGVAATAATGAAHGARRSRTSTWPARTAWAPRATPTSKVWFTVADGVLSDVYYPTIDNTNVETLQYVVTDGTHLHRPPDPRHDLHGEVPRPLRNRLPR